MSNNHQNLTRDVAELAKLELTTEELQGFTAQLDAILGYFDQLQKVDLRSLESEALLNEVSSVMREDEEQASLLDADGKPAVLLAAPDVLNDAFKVPPIL